jgi:hypothetical protein
MLPWCGNYVLQAVVCVLSAVRRMNELSHTKHGTQYTLYRLKHILLQHSNIFNDLFLLIILQKL